MFFISENELLTLLLISEPPYLTYRDGLGIWVRGYGLGGMG
jgi:hypothetical protein